MIAAGRQRKTGDLLEEFGESTDGQGRWAILYTLMARLSVTSFAFTYDRIMMCIAAMQSGLINTHTVDICDMNSSCFLCLEHVQREFGVLCA